MYIAFDVLMESFIFLREFIKVITVDLNTTPPSKKIFLVFIRPWSTITPTNYVLFTWSLDQASRISSQQHKQEPKRTTVRFIERQSIGHSFVQSTCVSHSTHITHSCGLRCTICAAHCIYAEILKQQTAFPCFAVALSHFNSSSLHML